MSRLYPAMYCRLLLYSTVLSSILGTSLSKLNLAPLVQEVVRYVNESYIVTCSDGTKKPVTWTTDKDEVIAEKGHPHVSRIGSGTALVFERIVAEDRGQYTCQSDEDNISFNLTVISPISFIDAPSEQTVQENHPAIIKCLVTGDPKPSVMWKFDGRSGLPPKFQPVEEGLKISKVTLEDRGTYTCRAYQVSQVTSMYEEKNIKLNVQHKPMYKKLVHAKVNQAYGYVGGEANLTCEAVAEPAADFTWFRPHKKLTTMPGRIIQRPHWSILQLYIQNASVFGDYLCKASNNLGTLDQIITLHEGVKPPKPQELRLRGVSSDTFNIEIKGPDLNQSQLPQEMQPTGYRLQYRPKATTDKWHGAQTADFNDVNEGGFYIINGLIHNTEYEVRAATRNIAGISDYTIPFVYRTLRLQADSITSGYAPLPVSQLAIALSGFILKLSK